MSKKCTREAHFQVKSVKNCGSRTTFGGSDVEKVHAVVARSTFPSQNVKNTRVSDHFCRFRCRFASLHCTTLHYTTLHSTTLHYITLHSTTLQLQLHNYTTTQLHNYIALHSTTLNYTPLHSTTLNYTTVHYTTLHYTTLHYITLHSTTLEHTKLHYTTLHYTVARHVILKKAKSDFRHFPGGLVHLWATCLPIPESVTQVYFVRGTTQGVTLS